MSTDVFRRYIDIVTESAAHAVTEMDKSQPSHGRDGHVSHSTYGSRDKEGSDYFKGKELPAKPITLKKMEKDALDILKKQGVAEGSYYPGEHGPEGVAVSDKTRQRGKPGGTYWAGSEGPDGVAIDDPNDVMPDKKPMVKKLGPKARAKTQMVKMYGDGEVTFRKTSNGGYFIQHEDDFGDTHSHQYDPKTGEVDFSGVTRSTYYGEGVAEGTKALADYIAESERAYSQPVTGDYFAINIREETLFETWVCDETADGIVIYADDQGLALLERYGYLGDAVMEMHHIDDYEADSDGSDVDVVDQGEYDFEGDQAKDQLRTIVRAARRLNGMLDDDDNLPEWVQMKITKAEDYIDTAADYMESNREQGVAEGFGTDPTQPGTWHGHKIVANRKTPKGSFLILQNKNDNRYEIHRQTPNAVGGLEFVSVHKTPEEMQTAFRQLTGVDESNQEMSEGDMAEAKYQGREVPLGKPMAGDVKKSKVYVRGPKGNVVKVNFGQKGMKIKKNIPGRRKNFRARHNCANPGPRWKARYWSCRAW